MSKSLKTRVARKVVHVFVNNRKYYYGRVSQFAEGYKNKTILELGSGYAVKGEYFYSAKHLFDPSNNFIQSDIVKDFGHPIIDITKHDVKNKYDLILCLNVLEHVYEYQKAIDNMYGALKKGGAVIIVVPAFYPLHDEPGDYWRFTEHALRKMLSKFELKELTHRGNREFPQGYYIEAVKK